MWKTATTCMTALGVSLCLAAVADAARPGGHPGGGGGGHPGGGGGAHFAAPHFSGGGHPGGGGGAHFAAPHFSGGRPGGGGAPHFAVRAAPHFAPRGGPGHFSLGHARTLGPGLAHFGRPSVHAFSRGRGPLTTGIGHGPAGEIGHAAAIGGRGSRFGHGRVAANPRAFARRRHFAANAAFRPFIHGGWHPYHHLGWVGPLFWPYAYGDVFYDALWPDDYADVDPLWVYGYGDIYEGIFSPYLYDAYVQGSRAPARMKALTQQLAQSCNTEATEVTDWPLDQIRDAVQPNPQQDSLLDALGNAIVKASDAITSHCAANVSFTPTGRLEEMQQRLQALVEAVNIVSPALSKFYDSLSDEQKARFNEIGTTGQAQQARARRTPNPPTPQAECGASTMAWPTEQIDRAVQPTDAQRTKLDALQAAAAKAADAIKAACPSEVPSTPPARLAAIGKHVQAMLQAVQIIRPPLDDFYSALNDDQKARFNAMGKQLFAANR